MAALLISAGTKREEILHIRQVAALNFATFCGRLLAFVCCCTCVAYVCAYVREKVTFEVYGGKSESMSDRYIFFCF